MHEIHLTLPLGSSDDVSERDIYSGIRCYSKRSTLYLNLAIQYSSNFISTFSQTARNWSVSLVGVYNTPYDYITGENDAGTVKLYTYDIYTYI